MGDARERTSGTALKPLSQANTEPGGRVIFGVVSLLHAIIAPLTSRDWRAQDKIPARGGVADPLQLLTAPARNAVDALDPQSRDDLQAALCTLVAAHAHPDLPARRHGEVDGSEGAHGLAVGE